MSKMKLPSVRKAFLIHFGISLIIFVVLAAMMRIIWYPDDLFWIDGGWQGLKIIAPIDLVLGPALTLCFYRPWKKNLKFDMSVIAAVQIAALGYGVYAAYNQRPAAIVFAENRFETLSLSTYRSATKELEENGFTPVPLREFGKGMPVVVHAEDFVGDDYGNYLADILNGLPELRERSDRYRNIADARDKIAKYRLGAEQTGTSIATSDDAGNTAGDTIEIPASSQSDSTKEDQSDQKERELYQLKGKFDVGTIEFDPATFAWIEIAHDAK